MCIRDSHIGAQKQVFHAYFYLFDVLHLDDMADVGGGKSVNLPDLLHGVVAVSYTHLAAVIGIKER